MTTLQILCVTGIFKWLNHRLFFVMFVSGIQWWHSMGWIEKACQRQHNQCSRSLWIVANILQHKALQNVSFVSHRAYWEWSYTTQHGISKPWAVWKSLRSSHYIEFKNPDVSFEVCDGICLGLIFVVGWVVFWISEFEIIWRELSDLSGFLQ